MLAQDRPPSGVIAQGNGARDEYRDLSQTLDGEAVPSFAGFDPISCGMVMFVPYHVTRCPATALAICKAQGLLIEKLDRMTPDARQVAWLTTIAKPLDYA